ncbi:hypothetical protein IAT38_000974 [Cryptococcus sp. DSM 104549]
MAVFSIVAVNSACGSGSNCGSCGSTSCTSNGRCGNGGSCGSCNSSGRAAPVNECNSNGSNGDCSTCGSASYVSSLSLSLHLSGALADRSWWCSGAAAAPALAKRATDARAPAATERPVRAAVICSSLVLFAVS